MLGGILRKPGIVAEMGIIALEKISKEVGDDNQAARKLSQRLQELGWIEITEKVETNMVFFKIIDRKINPVQLSAFLGTRKIKAFISAKIQDSSRLVTHHYIREAEIS